MLRLAEGVEEKLSISFAAETSEEISDISDSEICNFINTEEETKLKSHMWHQENGDWLHAKT
jgi:hypothetical protein